MYDDVDGLVPAALRVTRVGTQGLASTGLRVRPAAAEKGKGLEAS